MLLILPLASLAARRLPCRTVVRFVGVWFAVFGIVFSVVYLLSIHPS
jgi:putative Ca2+/H+ antiporter (TMEM165/GDT1 family)